MVLGSSNIRDLAMSHSNGEHAATDKQGERTGKRRLSTAGYFWISLFCLLCLIGSCVKSVIDGLRFVSFRAMEEANVANIAQMMAMVLGVIGAVTCGILILLDMAFNRRRVTWRWSLATLAIVGVTVAITLEFHKARPWLISALQQPVQTVPAGDDISAWLDKAEAAARKLPDESTTPGASSPRAQALETIAKTCLSLQQFDRGRRIAAELPEPRRKIIVRMMPMFLAFAGQYDAAVREAEASGNGSRLGTVAAIAAKESITKAMEIAARAPEASQSYAYGGIVSEQVLNGDLAGADTTAERVKEPDKAAESQRWLVAGRIAWAQDIAAAARECNVPLAGIGIELGRILERYLDANNPGRAREILDVLTTPEAQSSAWASFAKYFDAKGQTTELREAISKTLRHTAAISDANDIMTPIRRGAHYMLVAALQIKMGDVDEGLKTVRKLQQAQDEDANNLFGVSVLKMMSGRADVALFAQAGRLDDALKAATDPDGKIDPQSAVRLMEAYAAAGRDKELEQILVRRSSVLDDYQVYLAAANGAWNKMNAASRRAASGPAAGAPSSQPAGARN